ncbi:hypothetical protein ROR02_10230 [Pararhodospirillum oryzae]|uniref:Argininosuccinate lyase n=2 Tax=Pararhodospirillum oryzae TaxID=478448 RepID=A0A512H625_9PROT|nr:hypothetical protein ROR02_10230 [Pararhodospirillum oryzae]
MVARSLALAGALGVACVVGSGITPASASDYKFKLYNMTTQYTVNGFKTYEDGEWSANWLDETIKPGEYADMDWNSNEGDCVVPFRVSWIGYETEQYQVDWCKVSNIYLHDNGFTWD